MTDKIPEELLLPEGTIISILNNYIASGVENRIVFGHQIADAQLSNLLKAGYLSPEEHQKQIEEATRQGIMEWLTKHKETYWQEPDGKITLITRACWTPEEWQALKSGEGGKQNPKDKD